MSDEHRGIPIVGSGPSVMPGTHPLWALLAKERQAGGDLSRSTDGWRRFQVGDRRVEVRGDEIRIVSGPNFDTMPRIKPRRRRKKRLR